MGKRGDSRKRERLKRRLAMVERDCWLCLEPLDFSLPCGHPRSVEIDEEIPFSKGGNPLDYKGTHLVHRECNLKKGSRVLRMGALARGGGHPGKPTPSRKW